MSTAIESVNDIRWDLSVLYSDITDPQLNSDLAEFTQRAKRFELTYKGHLGELLGARD